VTQLDNDSGRVARAGRKFCGWRGIYSLLHGQTTHLHQFKGVVHLCTNRNIDGFRHCQASALSIQTGFVHVVISSSILILIEVKFVASNLDMNWDICCFLLSLLFLTGSIVDASEFGTSDIYTASIVAARNNVPVLLFRDAQCTLCPKVEDFLVGLGAPYQTVMTPFSLQTSRYFSCN
jgi:hypothetical protein